MPWPKDGGGGGGGGGVGGGPYLVMMGPFDRLPEPEPELRPEPEPEFCDLELMWFGADELLHAARPLRSG
jgi:hypothetical protein